MIGDNIPQDCIFVILSFLGERDIVGVSNVSRKWEISIVSRSERLWKEKYEERRKITELDEKRLKIVDGKETIFSKYTTLRRLEREFRIENPPLIKIVEGGIDEVSFVILGDKGIGKTCFSISYANGGNCFPDDWVPEVFEDFYGTVMYNKNKPLSINISDSTGDVKNISDYRLKTTTTYIVCFSLVDPSSLESVKKVWIPKLKDLCPGVPIILCGLKKELRDQALEKDIKETGSVIRSSVGEEYAKEIKAFCYLEVTSKYLTGMKEVFEAASDASYENVKKVEELKKKKKSKKKGKGGCIIS